MNRDLVSSIWYLWAHLLAAFKEASPLANAVTLLAPAISITLGVRTYIHRRIKDKDGVIADLRDDLADRQKKLDNIRDENEILERRSEQAEGRLAQVALAKAESEWHENNDLPSNRAITEWVQNEGRPISQMLYLRARWYLGHAAREVHSMGLVGAQAYAIAALALQPENNGAAELLGEVEGLLENADSPQPSIVDALTQFDKQADEIFEVDLPEAANAAEQEAILRTNAGNYHTALPAAEQAFLWRTQALGSKATPALRARWLVALILDRLGKYQEALDITQDVVDAQEDPQVLGPNHPDTLASRDLAANILDHLGKYEEALDIAQDVLKAQEDPQVLGPDPRDTLKSRYRVAEILDHLGKYEGALDIVQDVLKAQEDPQVLGPDLHDTLMSRYLVAEILDHLGRYGEALDIAQAVAKELEDLQLHGPNHPETLICRYFVAKILYHLGKYEEALDIAQDVLKVREDPRVLGPSHLTQLGAVTWSPESSIISASMRRHSISRKPWLRNWGIHRCWDQTTMTR